MANDDKDKTANNSKCSVCDETFSNIQDCLKHELVKHISLNTNRPVSRVQKTINATTKFRNLPEKLEEREKLHIRLKNCKDGEELKVIFDLFCMKTDSLSLIFTRIQTCLEQELRSAGTVKIHPFGSIGSGLALRDCDIDIFVDASNIQGSPNRKHCIENNKSENQQRDAFNRITNLLYRSAHFSDIFPIRKARVPIIKCKHKNTGFSIDINVSCPSSRENTQFIYDVVKSDERIHEFLLFIKLWAKNMQIVGRAHMTSYCLINMAIFLLQQPWKKDGGNVCILKSIRELQQNCPIHMVQGINYAYNLSTKANQPKIPAAVKTWDLIAEFFNFYKNFNFEHLIISPYYGKAVEKNNLTPDICNEYYKQLKTITYYMQGNEANHLQTDRCMCIQDGFSLNQNTAKTVLPQSKQYFVLCLLSAHHICENSNHLTKAELYEKLLFDTIKITIDNKAATTKSKVNMEFENLLLPGITTYKNNSSSSLLYSFTPSKTDLRTLAYSDSSLKRQEDVLRSWCEHYIEAIEVIITKIYRIDMQKQLPAQQKQLKLEKENKLNQTWHISGTVDLWTNRSFQRKNSFMLYQMEQTKRLHSLRRQNQQFSVNLNAILKLNVLKNYMGIDVQLDLPEDTTVSNLNKKSPLCKFFNMLKNTLQSYNLKEALNMIDTNKKQSTEGHNLIEHAKIEKNTGDS